MPTTSSESLGDTLLAVTIAAAVAWAVSTKPNRSSAKTRRRRRVRPFHEPGHDPCTRVESDWEEFDRESAELEAVRRQQRARWATDQAVLAKHA